jgi:hypothetical protein
MIKVTLQMSSGDTRVVECFGYSIDQAFFKAKIVGSEIIISMNKIEAIVVPAIEQEPEQPSQVQYTTATSLDTDI